MSPDPTPAPASQSQALDAAANDAHAHTRSRDGRDEVASCPRAGRPPPPPPPSSLWVRINLPPAAAQNEQGSLRLRGSSGRFDQTTAIASSFVPNPDCDTVDVHFENVPTQDSYSLSYIAGDGAETTIIQNAPFNGLQDNSSPNT